MNLGMLPFCVLLAALLPNHTALAQTSTPVPKNGTESQEVQAEDERLLFEEMPLVISATRTPRQAHLSPVPVGVVTADDIRLSGQTNLPEILQFATGVDMVRYDRFRYVVGIRGLHEVFSDRTIAMINGRNASTPLFGGTEFLRLPVLLDDIERVELVRGPGGAAWGANAFNGVINIITKKPQDVAGCFLRTDINHFGDHYLHARWAGSEETLGWRISVGHQKSEDSDSALTGESFASSDYFDSTRLDTELAWDFDEGTRVTAGVAASSMVQGGFDWIDFSPGGRGDLDNLRLFLRADHTFSDRTSGYVQLFGNFEDTDSPALGRFNTIETDLEMQLDMDLGEGHELTVGGNLRHVTVRNGVTDPQQATLVGAPHDEQWAGLFLINRNELSDDVAFETQLRGDHYSETGFDWSGRVSGLFTLDEAGRHVLRVSGAKAFRAALTGLRTASTKRQKVGPSFLVHLNPNDDLDNEQLYSLELGHTFRATDNLVFTLNTYCYRYQDLIGFVTVNPGLPHIVSLDNIDGASAYGAELEFDWQNDDFAVKGWYAFHELDTDDGGQSIRAFHPSQHKAGLNTRANLTEDLTLNLGYKLTGRTPSEESGQYVVDAFHRVDLSLSQSLLGGRGEFMFGVSDLFDEMDIIVPGTTRKGSTASAGLHRTPGRTFFVSMRFTF